MLSLFFKGSRPDFVDTYADYVRTSQQDIPAEIQIPNTRFRDDKYIFGLFVNNGRVPERIDSTSFENKVGVITKDGELWYAEYSDTERASVFKFEAQIRPKEK